MIGRHSPKWKKLPVVDPRARYPLVLPYREFHTPLTIFAVDPGGTTGWSLLQVTPDFIDKPSPEKVFSDCLVNWWHGQIDCLTDEVLGGWQLTRIASRWPTAAIVFEDFNLRQLAVDLSPVRITSRFEEWLWLHNRYPLLKQSASQAKTTATDPRLKLWECYTSEGGLGHARDADRHALTFLRRCMKASGKTSTELRAKAFGDWING